MPLATAVAPARSCARATLPGPRPPARTCFRPRVAYGYRRPHPENWPPELCKLVARCLAQRPADRPSASEVRRAAPQIAPGSGYVTQPVQRCGEARFPATGVATAEIEHLNRRSHCEARSVSMAASIHPYVNGRLARLPRCSGGGAIEGPGGRGGGNGRAAQRRLQLPWLSRTTRQRSQRTGRARLKRVHTRLPIRLWQWADCDLAG